MEDRNCLIAGFSNVKTLPFEKAKKEDIIDTTHTYYGVETYIEEGHCLVKTKETKTVKYDTSFDNYYIEQFVRWLIKKDFSLPGTLWNLFTTLNYRCVVITAQGCKRIYSKLKESHHIFLKLKKDYDPTKNYKMGTIGYNISFYETLMEIFKCGSEDGCVVFESEAVKSAKTKM